MLRAIGTDSLICHLDSKTVVEVVCLELDESHVTKYENSKIQDAVLKIVFWP